LYMCVGRVTLLKMWINFVLFSLTVDSGPRIYRFNFGHTVETKGIQEAILTPLYMLTPSDLLRPNSAQYY